MLYNYTFLPTYWSEAMKTMTEKQRVTYMAKVEKRRSILETQVQSIVKGFTSAMFVWGPPGLGKSHLLTTMLDGIAGHGWRHHTAYTTPKAMFMALMEEPYAIHLYEDCERVLKTDLSASILRAACGAPNERSRWVTYETAHAKLRVEFFGGIIIATNENLSRLNGPLQGVASRFRPIKWDMDLNERIASIFTIAKSPCVRGGVPLSVKECLKVATRLVEMCTDSNSAIDLDLRLFTEHALPAFAQAKQQPGMKWEDLMHAKLLGVATTVEDSQVDRTRKMQQLAQKIAMEGGNTKAKVAKWKELTGLGQAIYFRHLKTSKQMM
jgi:hypothetical protein